MAVGIGARNDFRGNRAARAAAIVDHPRLAQRGLQPWREDARDGVGGAAGRETDDESYRALGVWQRLRGGGQCRAEDGYERARRNAGERHARHANHAVSCRTTVST